MNCFALVTEGPCDQEVISNILIGFNRNKNLDLNLVQPNRSLSKNESQGGWHYLVNFLQTENFRNIYQFNKYVVIHIDTDICEEPYFSIKKTDSEGKAKPIYQVYDGIKSSLINAIGSEFYNKVANRTIFAIPVDSIECWLLPIFYSNNQNIRNKSINCLNALNEYLKNKTTPLKAKSQKYTMNYHQRTEKTKI
ncbi:hypothetical protein [Hymenobacter sp. GOD-10R]|uniref:hypothetical protein n=1 Tax=Hymenobacter sp. GOD-10R TaxID=3093922 RepID=UPI002D77B955|nr:hypothetical protein [Hymenobacter sp. GOD-10R]WRQ29754.1 hypothetical protein SD425_05685 [Hymenobacter sp. GOD-10R]